MQILTTLQNVENNIESVVWMYLEGHMMLSLNQHVDMAKDPGTTSYTSHGNGTHTPYRELVIDSYFQTF